MRELSSLQRAHFGGRCFGSAASEPAIAGSASLSILSAGNQIAFRPISRADPEDLLQRRPDSFVIWEDPGITIPKGYLNHIHQLILNGCNRFASVDLEVVLRRAGGRNLIPRLVTGHSLHGS